MHDYARKPRGRKVFSGRWKRRRRAARRENERWGKRRKGGVERKRDNVCYWDTSFLASLSFYFSTLLLPATLAPLATFPPPTPPLLHLSNLNAYRRLSSPRLAVLSAEITCALTDLWEAARRGRLNLAAMFFPRRVHIHRNVAIASRIFVNIFFPFFLSFFFSNVNCSIILSKGRDWFGPVFRLERSSLSWNKKFDRAISAARENQ